jgi:hypothetical protein
MLVGARFRICMPFLWLGLYAAPVLAGTSRCAPVSENAVTFHGNEDIVISIVLYSLRPGAVPQYDFRVIKYLHQNTAQGEPSASLTTPRGWRQSRYGPFTWTSTNS